MGTFQKKFKLQYRLPGLYSIYIKKSNINTQYKMKHESISKSVLNINKTMIGQIKEHYRTMLHETINPIFTSQVTSNKITHKNKKFH